MSELIEINKGNCVLDDRELEILDTVLKSAMERANDKMLAKSYLGIVFLKIAKLNDMAKEKQK